MESGTHHDTRNRHSRPRWPRFSLRTFLIVCAGIGVLLGVTSNTLVFLARVRHQRQIVSEIAAAGFVVQYDYQRRGESIDGRWQHEDPTGPKFIRLLVGDDAFAYVEAVTFHESLDRRFTSGNLARLSELPRLKSVAISAPGLTDEGMRHLSRIRDLTDLIVTREPSITSEGLASLAAAKNLQRLSLSGSLSGSTITDETIAPLAQLHSLKSLGLHRTSVTSDGLVAVRGLSKLEELELVMSSAVNDEALQHLVGLKRLRRLQLAGTGVTDAGLPHLRKLPNLQWLGLEQCDVSDAGMEHIAQLSELRWLSLSSTAVSDEAMTDLAELRSLRHLMLSNTNVTDAWLPPLRKLTELEDLWIGPNVTHQAALDLKDHLPRCSITGVAAPGVRSFEIPAE